jgi:hypothetical protein
MIEKRLFSLLIFISCSLSAQIKGIIKDSLTGKPIPYVNIWVENENIGSTSEGNGTFFINSIEKGKKLIFSTLGFEKKIIKASEASEVFLKPIAYSLDEVVISKSIGTKSIEIGYYESNGFRYHINFFVNAIYFDISDEEREKHPFIKEFKFNTLSIKSNAKIKIYFVTRNKDGSPGEKSLTEEIILEVKKGNSKNIVDLSKMKIVIPEKGFFIVFEKLKIDQNIHSEEYSITDKDGKKIKRKGISYQPDIQLSPTNDEVGWYKTINNKWQKSSKTIIQNPNSFEKILMKKYNDKYLVPSVNITLSN